MPLDDATLPNVIADVQATLRQALRDEVPELNPEGRVSFSSPADLDVTADPLIGLFLYQMMEIPQMRNQPPEPDGTSGDRRCQTLELYYLVTSYARQIEDGHRLLGKVMRTFFENAILRGPVLQGSLADMEQELRVLLQPLSLEDVNRLWSVFPGKAYRLSIAYQVTPVKIFSRSAVPPGRVITRDLGYAKIFDRGEKRHGRHP